MVFWVTTLCITVITSDAFLISNNLSPHFQHNVGLAALPSSFVLSDLSEADGGMSLEEIKNYVSNIGGGLCGLPDSLKTLVGLTLNISLLLFGILTVGYVVLGIWSFALERTIDDDIRKTPYGYNLLDAKDEVSGSSSSSSSNQMDTTPGVITSLQTSSIGFDGDQESSSDSNRGQRRLKKRIK